MKQQEKVSKTVGYVRVSTTMQASEGESLDTQRSQIKEYCQTNNLDLVKIYEDAGVSGGKAEKRPGFMEMVADAKNGLFDRVVFTKLSRFARNARDYHTFQMELQDYGVNLSSIKEGIDPTTFNGRLMAGIFALLAEWEREMIKEQMAENKMARWREKRIFNGNPPYGYIWDKKACEFVVNSEESEILTKMFTWYVNLGLSIRQVVEKLRNEGYKGRVSNWTTGTVGGIFRNPCYSTGKVNANTRIYKDGKRTKELKSESEWIVFDLPKIIPKSLCDAVDRRRDFNRIKQKRTLWQQDHWLRDCLYCANCDGKMNVSKRTKRKNGFFPKRYTCFWAICSESNLKINNGTRCHQGNCPADQLEDYVWDALCFNLTGSHKDTKMEALLQDEAEEQFSFLSGGNIDEQIADLEGKLSRLRQEMAKKERANGRLLDLLEAEDMGMDIGSLQAKYRENENAIASFKEKIQEEENNILELRQVQQDQESYFNNRQVLFHLWSDLQEFSADDKKRMIESLVPNGVKVSIEPNPSPRKYHFKRLGPENVKFEVVWNPHIFQYFNEQGKFPSLCRDGCEQTATADGTVPSVTDCRTSGKQRPVNGNDP